MKFKQQKNTKQEKVHKANDCKGITAKGNDDMNYKSEPDKRGIYRWVKYIIIIQSIFLNNILLFLLTFYFSLLIHQFYLYMLIFQYLNYH